MTLATSRPEKRIPAGAPPAPNQPADTSTQSDWTPQTQIKSLESAAVFSTFNISREANKSQMQLEGKHTANKTSDNRLFIDQSSSVSGLNSAVDEKQLLRVLKRLSYKTVQVFHFEGFGFFFGPHSNL